MQDDEFIAVQDAVRDFIRAEVMPREAEIEETDQVPDDVRAMAVAMGLFGYTLPEEFGGMNATVEQDVRLAIEFGYTSLAFRSMFGTNNGIAGQVLVNYGSPDQQQTWLPRLAAGAVASFALTETEAGSDPSGMRTRAADTGDGYYEISGSKRFITNAVIADLFMVFARTADAPEPGSSAGISCFLAEGGTPGLTVGPKDAKTGQAGAWTSEVHFDRVRVPASSLVGGTAGAGFAAAMRSLMSKGRLHIAGLCVGSAQRLVDESVAYASTSRQGGLRADRRVPAHPGDARRDEDWPGRGPGPGARCRPPLRLRSGPQDRPVVGEAVLRRDGVPGCRPGRADPWRREYSEAGHDGRADRQGRAGDADLRRHQRSAEADHRPRTAARGALAASPRSATEEPRSPVIRAPGTRQGRWSRQTAL